MQIFSETFLEEEAVDADAAEWEDRETIFKCQLVFLLKRQLSVWKKKYLLLAS